MKKLLTAALISFMLTTACFSDQATQATETVDINTADAATISRVLDGIGGKKAEAIVTYREQNGPFKSVADLENVYGIGGKTIEKNVDKIRIGDVGMGAMQSDSMLGDSTSDEPSESE